MPLIGISLLEQGYQIPGAKPKMALLYLKDADFAAVLAKAEQLRADYDVTVLPQAKKLGKQFGTLEAAGFNAVAFADNEDVKLLGQKAEKAAKNLWDVPKLRHIPLFCIWFVTHNAHFPCYIGEKGNTECLPPWGKPLQRKGAST